ncbi:MAG: bifunctional phosphoribosylaminoimidazolecarboxamide formyltransferase/IMP cyclohydrolase [Planctomycetota bacterium]|jgi:phosphoribosylaminoimidazolecarboxamide formyltransferase/IMP cyclohydrolase
MDNVKITRALVSVSDKTGIVELCQALVGHGAEIVSTGGTAAKLREAGLEVKDISDHTGFPEMLDGRVKTLHPKVHGGLLARRDLDAHMNTAKDHDIGMIDAVIVNLYPFEQTVAKPDVARAEAIEQIDIGGPSMVRSGAKNHGAVSVITDPADYESIISELIENDGALSLKTRRAQALKAFRVTSWYDHAIAEYLHAQEHDEESTSPFELIALKSGVELRYGENPHQTASFYATGRHSQGLGGHEKLSGKDLSYNNLLDLDAALRAVSDISNDPYAIVIKHTNPCGAATGGSIAEAFSRSYACDPLSAFGGIVGLNRPFDVATAEQFIEGEKFLEAVVAPEFHPDAIEALMASKKKWRKSIRLVKATSPNSLAAPLEYRSVGGGMLVQQTDVRQVDAGECKVVTEKKPDDIEMKELLFAWGLCKHYKSNAICLTRSGALLGYGAGQTSRVDATDHALLRAGEKAKGAVLASDAFFPFPDSIEKAAAAGVSAVIQPGGSVRDEAVVEECNKHGMAMVFTGMRHFKH